MILQASKRLRKFFDSTLTDEMIREEIIEEQRLNNIHQLRRLNQEAAQTLIQLEKRMELLALGITELPRDVAEELVKYKGEKLFLNCVTSLSVETAKIMAGFNGFKLMLNGVRDVSISILGRFATYKGMIYLDGVEDLEIKEKDGRRAQTVFRNLEFGKLSMSGIQKPSVQLLNALALFRGQLVLNGISSLSREEAEILGECPGNGLTLKGIKVLSFELLKLFTQFTGFLDVSGAVEIEDEFVRVAAARPEAFSLFSGAVKRRIDEYKKELAREKRKAERDTREIKLKALEKEREVNRKDLDLLAEFEKFDNMEPALVTDAADGWEEDKPDPHGPEIEESVVNDIEIHLNREINLKRKKVDALMEKGIANLSGDEKALLRELEDSIEELKTNIRGALDVLVEKKELGSVVFGNSDDLAAYLREAGAEDDENDALSNIEDIDMFGGSFGSGDDDEDPVPGVADMDLFGDGPDSAEQPQKAIEGDDFVFSEV
ncbi:MAG: hypothetical protein GY940_36215 [bacterium]|nr:hypothetical protein [bacterium]